MGSNKSSRKDQNIILPSRRVVAILYPKISRGKNEIIHSFLKGKGQIARVYY
jgi:hypothetical protein